LKYILLFFLSFLLFVPLSSSAVTSKTLKHDLAYYHKVSKEKHLDANDRYYILLRISAKYDGTKVDLTALHAEMKKLKPASQKTNGSISSHRTPLPQTAEPVKETQQASTPPENTETKPAPEKPQIPIQPAAITIPTAAVSEKTSDKTPGTNDIYEIEIGDILTIAIFPTEELSRETVVQTDGSISFPLIGRAQAKGLTTKQLEVSLAKNLSRFVSNPQVSISIKQFSHHQVIITGEVRSVGTFSYRDKIRLMEFISTAGGFTDAANRKEIKIYRGPPTNRKTYTVDVEDIIRSGDFSKDFVLEPGDIIEVPKGQSRISILGDIRSPGYYDFRSNMHLMDLISLAGGYSDTANINSVTIIHAADVSKNQRTVKVNLKKILSGSQNDVEIQSGDTVYVPRKALASSNVFINTILPWLTLISLVFVIRAGV
jgi:protein involved in polysaccharide export with SLBB domain